MKYIEDLFLLSDSGVAQASRRFEAAMEVEGQLEKMLNDRILTD